MEDFFYDGIAKGLNPQHLDKIERMLSSEEHAMRERSKAPLHPGHILKHDYIQPLSLSVAKLATYLGISKKTLYRIVSEQSAITPKIALRLA